MDPSAEVLELLAEWRRLAQVEKSAIVNEDWARLADLRRGKEPLCVKITETLARARALACSNSAVLARAEQSFAARAAELFELETQNRDLIRGKRKAKQAQMDHLATTTRNLQGVRRAYGGSCPQLWQSYS